MVRTGFKRAEPKPSKGPKLKKCANRDCRAPYQVDPKQLWKNWCSEDCGAAIGLAKLAGQKAKKQRQERAQDKAKLDTFKTYPQLIAACQKVFNAVVRQRDMDQPCICCGREGTKVDALHAHGWDCGHYRSVGSAPQLRFNFDNAHRQLVYCNRHGAGRAVDYRLGLIARIGLERVEALEADNTTAKWTHDDLRQMTKEFQAQLREMKKGQ